MDVETAHWLVSDEAAGWLDRALGEPDPGSLGAAGRFRRDLPGDRAAAVLDQAVLWRRAEALGRGVRAQHAPGLRFVTAAGLEQATRPAVAAWRAARLWASGVRRVADLGCGLGLDALAMVAAGIEVRAVEKDPVTAFLAGANLGSDVRVGAAEDAGDLVEWADAVFCDPARRTARGRSWDVADLSPGWDFVLALLDGSRTACVKLGPGVQHRVLPDQAEVTWVSHDGDAVEATVWAGPRSVPGRRAAVLLPSGANLEAGPIPSAAPVGRWLIEPDPAVIRSGAIGTLAANLGLHPVADGVAYLTGDADLGPTPYGTRFEVVEVLPYDVRTLKGWVRDNDIGTLEIKKRGVEFDPAALRKELKPSGSSPATLVVTPTMAGTKALVVRRIADPRR